MNKISAQPNDRMHIATIPLCSSILCISIATILLAGCSAKPTESGIQPAVLPANISEQTISAIGDNDSAVIVDEVSKIEASVAPVATARPGLDTLVVADPAAQQSLVEMLTRVLIGPDQLELAGSAPLADLIAPLISAYNEIADEPIIAATADLYRDARLNFTAFNLPESLAQLMDFLQAIE